MECYCKDHNSLCCFACLCKIKKEGYWQHSYCNVSLIDDINDEKRNKLQENIYNSEKLYEQIYKSINNFKEIFEKINKNKDDLKLKIQSIFTKLRNELLNGKEDKLLLDIDEYYNNIYYKEYIIKKSEKLPYKI